MGSGDCSAIRNVDNMTCQLTVTTNKIPRMYLLGTTQIVNHTAITQSTEWSSCFSEMVALYNELPLVSNTPMAVPLEETTFYSKFRGYVSDHSADNGAVVKLMIQEHDQHLHQLHQDAALAIVSAEEHTALACTELT